MDRRAEALAADDVEETTECHEGETIPPLLFWLPGHHRPVHDRIGKEAKPIS